MVGQIIIMYLPRQNELRQELQMRSDEGWIKVYPEVTLISWTSAKMADLPR